MACRSGCSSRHVCPMRFRNVDHRWPCWDLASFSFASLDPMALLIASNNPAIASVRFIQILEIVLIGMSIYGTVWFVLREKISDAAGARRQTGFLQAHTLINLCLMLGLSGIIFFKFWKDGRIAGDGPARWAVRPGSSLWLY